MISGTLSAENFLSAQLLHHQSFRKRQSLLLLVFLFLGLSIAFTRFSFIGIVLIGMGAGGMIGQFFISRFLLPRRQLRLFRQQVSLRSKFVYSWDAENISVVSDSGRAKRPWSTYIKSKENDQVFLLYHTDIMFEVIPKTWFCNPEQLVEFRLLAKGISG